MTGKKKTGLALGLILTGIILSVGTMLYARENTGKSLENKLDRMIKSYDVQGASYLIIRDGKPGEVHNYGYANTAEKRKVNDHTAFKIASISKTVTAYAVMQLADEKKLNLDVPVQKYIRNWKLPASGFSADKVTLRTLMSHTAGVSDSSEFGYAEPLPSVAEALTQRNIRLIREPGTSFAYSSFSGFAICQLVIENITGEKFEDYMKIHVFQKCGMENAGYYNQSTDQVTMATPYAGMARPVAVTPIVMTGAGGISATSSDMAEFVIAMMQYYRTGSREMFQVQKNTESVFGVYGLGIIPHRIASGKTVYEHNGTLTGWNAQIAFEPESRNGIVFLCNSDKGYYLTNEVMRCWSRNVTGYPVEDKAFESRMSSVITGICAILFLTFLILSGQFIWKCRKKERVFLSDRKQKVKLTISLIITGMILGGWYGVMYTDLVFRWFFHTADYYPFTFFTRNIDKVGYTMSALCAAIIIRRIFPLKNSLKKENSIGKGRI